MVDSARFNSLLNIFLIGLVYPFVLGVCTATASPLAGDVSQGGTGGLPEEMPFQGGWRERTSGPLLPVAQLYRHDQGKSDGGMCKLGVPGAGAPSLSCRGAPFSPLWVPVGAFAFLAFGGGGLGSVGGLVAPLGPPAVASAPAPLFCRPLGDGFVIFIGVGRGGRFRLLLPSPSPGHS